MLCYDFPLFCVLSLLLKRQKAIDLLLELVPFIFLLTATGCVSLSLCDCCLKSWCYSSVSSGLKSGSYIEDIWESHHRAPRKGANHQRMDL